jgi:pSer/pThr/pTyr-binding forkhead associated (FHA) protein
VFKDRQKVESVKMEVGIFSFGRLPECSMQLEHGSISRRHAALAYDEDGDLFLVDLGSAHGTYLDSKQIRFVDFSGCICGPMGEML